VGDGELDLAALVCQVEDQAPDLEGWRALQMHNPVIVERLRST
jgi:hypothetical protein